ncbi:hypothetical protein [Tannockella kyphosi]|uniref:hypothetical protein n=1 Tax=Tannockella kyphosi TaxID=2899121 RepID=UPI0020127FAA|nr:hypothetical protein [Tannockella kyphosi]
MRKIRLVFFIIILLLILYLLQLLLIPKYMTSLIEGAFIEEYYYNQEGYDEKDHDVIFIGDCEVYSNFIPAVLYEEYGINSYVRGSAQQLIWQSYYILEDTLNYEVPDVVVFNVSTIRYDEPQKEEYNRMTLDGMNWSISKINSITTSMLESESLLDYVFPILRYHSRWSELTFEDFEYMFSSDLVSYNGYYLRVDTQPYTSVPNGSVLETYDISENVLEYLDKITNLCDENDIELILIKAPSLYPYWYDEWDEQITNYALNNDITYINFLDYTNEIGLDYNTDTYDGGSHLNLYGATKLTSYFGEILSTQFELEDRSDEEVLSSLWEIKLERYYEDIEIQKELYGVE